MNVTLLNPDVLKNLYKNHGEFACECYDTPKKYAERVGKSCEESGHMSGSRCEYIKFEIEGDRGTLEQTMRSEIGVRYNPEEKYYYMDRPFFIRPMAHSKLWICRVPNWYYEDSIKSKGEAIKIAEDYIEANYRKL